MSEIVVPLSTPPRALSMGPDAHDRLGRIEAARDALRLARTPPPPVSLVNAPLPPSFEEALIARAAFATVNAPSPPPPPPPPQTPAGPNVELWATERDPTLRSDGAPAPVANAAAADPRSDWRPAIPDDAAPARPVVVDPARLAADPRSVFGADTIEALRTRHLGDLPIRIESER